MVKPFRYSLEGKSARARAQIVRRVCERLEAAYGRPRLGNPGRLIDDLFFVIISNRTAPEKAARTYRALKARFRPWDAIAGSSVEEIERVLRPAGLARKKAAQILGIARRLRQDFGRVTLSPLKALPDAEVEKYLCSLPGVSTKVAYCVMMYTMGREVLPVDEHVYRVSKRLGWIGTGSARQSHEALARVVPPQWRYVFHVGCVCLGREVCRPTRPEHGVCPVRAYCREAHRTDAT